ncbi:CRISPR-associated endonuclease Cas1 [Geitlerinema sp. P-1104]|uniref:CRISPR-associated endonuclease Cas1 n=1 Tax=Geitlerinema sp. P-1104 TaxID=2546230 RepID=UPI001476B445|nr:CRISPR-associated endonuclease Cas1 [Geitlerinema sp. P-1104]NMG59496.1 CRISPR-associated endonuclease Cas1 [Geitlerinema sp. P-1104]
MQTLYLSRQGCYICLQQEQLLVKQREQILAKVQLPRLEQVLIFGKSQMTTQAIRACLQRDIPIAYLSRLGYCYGRILPIERGYRQLARYQQQLSQVDRLIVAQNIVRSKLKNSRTLLLRQRRRHPNPQLDIVIEQLAQLIKKISKTHQIDALMGIEGAGAAQYFPAFGQCLTHSDFQFRERRRRPPSNPVNALLSFGYQVLWNHLLSLLELQGLDPYHACLHSGSERHAALASDLIEEFRAPLVDSLVLWLINSRTLTQQDFEYRDQGCFLNDQGRSHYLKYFAQRMEETIQAADGSQQPRWHLLSQQVKAFKKFVYQPSYPYQPYEIR